MKKQIGVIAVLFFISTAVVGQLPQPGMGAGEIAAKKTEFQEYLKNRKWLEAEKLIQELKARRQNAIATQWEVEYYKAGGPNLQTSPPVPPREEKKKDIGERIGEGLKEGEVKIIDVGKEAEKAKRTARTTQVLDTLSDRLAKKKAIIEMEDRANKAKSAISDLDALLQELGHKSEEQRKLADDEIQKIIEQINRVSQGLSRETSDKIQQLINDAQKASQDIRNTQEPVQSALEKAQKRLSDALKGLISAADALKNDAPQKQELQQLHYSFEKQLSKLSDIIKRIKQISISQEQERKSKTTLMLDELDALADTFSSSGDKKDAELIKNLRNAITEVADPAKQMQSMSLGKDVLDKIMKEQEAKSSADFDKAYKDLDALLGQQGELENRSNKELQDLLEWSKEIQTGKNYNTKLQKIDELKQGIAKEKQKLRMPGAAR
jgi:hypothetical protein